MKVAYARTTPTHGGGGGGEFTNSGPDGSRAVVVSGTGEVSLCAAAFTAGCLLALGNAATIQG